MIMKRIIVITSVFLLFTFCKEEKSEICGCENPTTELQWLNELIQKAETDTTGLYLGSIYFEVYNNEQMFYVLMPLEPVDHILKHWLDCNGNPILKEPSDILPQPKLNHLIYSNIK